MSRWSRILQSSVFQKVIMALTGLCLILFVIMHLLGNLSLYKADGTPFNKYAAMLHSFGGLLYVAEVGLLVLFVVHIATALRIQLGKNAARDVGYKLYKSKGGPSRANLSSRFMIYSGVVILFFLVLHIWQFRFGPNIEQGYVTQINGEQVRDLHKLVTETFHNPVFVIIYVFAMIMLGFHLRHGFWSAFQSLGARSPSLHSFLTKLAPLLAIVISLGFLGIPLWIYFH
jgi:succinate dehydrogenase / fumarate reductase cytochrome b subunit